MRKLFPLILCFVSILSYAQVGNDLESRLKPIKENFNRINSISEWSKIKQQEILDLSDGGGEVKYYYSENNLEKLFAIFYGETGKVISEYYFLNGEISFVFEQEYQYNRPIYWDEKQMKENNDSEVFDIEKSRITDTRNYFENGKLIHQLPKGNSDFDSKVKKIKSDIELYLLTLNTNEAFDASLKKK